MDSITNDETKLTIIKNKLVPDAAEAIVRNHGNLSFQTKYLALSLGFLHFSGKPTNIAFSSGAF